MSTRVTAAVDFVVDDRVPVATAARVMQVSREAVCQRMAPAPRDSPTRFTAQASGSEQSVCGVRCDG